MATMAGLSVATPRVVGKDTPRASLPGSVHLNYPLKLGSRATRMPAGRMVHARPVRAAPDRITGKVEKSIKDAEETCADDPKSGECVAAWDEVEELSAAASHARDRQKAGGSDPLENYCADNPETDECRTYDN